MSERQRLIELGLLVPAVRARTPFERYLDQYFRCLALDAKTRAEAERIRWERAS